MFCSKCGAQMADRDRFCSKCGAAATPPVRSAAPAQYAAPAQAPIQPVAPVQAQVQVQPQIQPQYRQQPAQIPFDFSRIPIRYRCANGHVFDSGEELTQCTKCGAPLPSGGFIQLYRMGNYMGMAVGMGVYIDDVPCGHLGNKQSIRISVPYGSHKVHVTHTTTRACNDPIFTVTPEYPYAWCKAHFSGGGFRITVEQADPQDMPAK